ncbi:tRNA(Met) cytidine acetyltransferase TmcA [Serratia quinivorans]|uniref:tRNA(Met) cytidine acetyltransferase TmcA n=1 Tax=Serratia quinivorans TaxID=137545 RepID=UPI002178AC6E|nr:GNAT family N-acetyltransferase [Serratia quinivorans]CAI0943097.1 tRNA(Met) cytidine acetyltransferase TmcA [Serratia quinivorans]CAI1818910.1 tRNA(Met) cytidine acetyltransferase TmcA [Serratia quinivorans]CAI1905431.1 tRNA(Met) cytidine acetyltransferase TmcA [Serratia quinivorans]CAI1983784.1 tRNA(Met) cytidine acetyltransferase TmcA [Serratia quinivorans]
MLQAMQQLMQQQGIRRLLVLSGEPQWCRQQAHRLATTLSGDWPWVGENPPSGMQSLASGAVRTLLGQERLHAVYDATEGLDVEALAALAGTLRAGSWLLLLTPPWQSWHQRPDSDSLRWSDCPQPITTPNFIHHLQQHLVADSEVTLWRQDEPLTLAPLPVRPQWQAPNGQPTFEQQALLTQLLGAEPGVWVLTAARGRGKSTLAGMLVANTPLTCWLTGPSRAATEVAGEWAQGRAQFWAPDALLAHCREHDVSDVGWLLVDEAAAIPGPLLRQWVNHFPRILLTTTVQGYEGTGRGFLLKFCAGLPEFWPLELQQPMRWAQGDALERVIDNALLFNELPPWQATEKLVSITGAEQRTLCADPQRLMRFYALLSSAHYRTSPLDLRRLMDAPGMHFGLAQVEDEVVGALWLVEEGGLSTELAHEVWAGRRRPRGNLVAQSLAAHGGQWWAPTLRSRRITRIAVLPAMRQQGIARRLIEQQRQQAQGLDYLSVSFGYTEPLWRFWQSCGFELARIGSKIEASSGCYSVMAILPLSEQGEALRHAAHKHLARDWRWLQPRIDLQLEVTGDDGDTRLGEDDWRELAGFAFAHRPLEASLGALQRLLLASALPLPALRLHLQQQTTSAGCVELLGFSGQKALLRRWRQETGMALEQLDAQHCLRWHDWSQSLQ